MSKRKGKTMQSTAAVRTPIDKARDRVQKREDGGLISRETIRKTDELRLALYDVKRDHRA